MAELTHADCERLRELEKDQINQIQSLRAKVFRYEQRLPELQSRTSNLNQKLKAARSNQLGAGAIRALAARVKQPKRGAAAQALHKTEAALRIEYDLRNVEQERASVVARLKFARTELQNLEGNLPTTQRELAQCRLENKQQVDFGIA